MIYLDYNASTPVDPAVREAMLPYLGQHYGNPSSSHALGTRLKEAVDYARTQVAALLGTEAGEIIFTSGTTGIPKGTMHFHRDVLAICDCFPPHTLQSRADDIFIGTPPLAFSNSV